MSKPLARRFVMLSAVLSVSGLGIANSQEGDGLICDGPNRTPILYEDADFKGQSLRIFLEDYEPLYLSDEETFARRASSVCIQRGFVVRLYDGEGYGIEIDGPVQMNLSELDFDDRAYAGMARRVEIPTEPEATEVRPSIEPDYSAYEAYVDHLDEALSSDDCDFVTDAHRIFGSMGDARDPVPPSAMLEYQLGRPVLGEYVQKTIRRVRQAKAAVCEDSVGAGTTSVPAPQTAVIDRYYAMAIQTSDCAVVKEMSERIATGLEPENVSYAMEKIQSLRQDRSSCFAEDN